MNSFFLSCGCVLFDVHPSSSLDFILCIFQYFSSASPLPHRCTLLYAHLYFRLSRPDFYSNPAMEMFRIQYDIQMFNVSFKLSCSIIFRSIQSKFTIFMYNQILLVIIVKHYNCFLGYKFDFSLSPPKCHPVPSIFKLRPSISQYNEH